MVNSSGADRPGKAPAQLTPLPSRASGPMKLLPRPLTTFVGREREVAAAAAMLSRDDVRLLTLIGPGGVGKTRLALAVAQALAGGFTTGVVFVPLAPIHDADLVAPTIAQTLGIQDVGGRPVIDILRTALRDQQILLVLDNFEQVVDASRIVADLLTTSPALKVLATSRTRLRVSAEQAFPVPALIVPENGGSHSLDLDGETEAVRLFVERAQRVNPDFTLTETNIGEVAAICHRVEGLPLAIELAAARTKHLPPAMMLARLEKRLPLLTGGPRDVPDRHQTMRDAIAWSYDLLNDEMRTLFRRLAVFAGGFTLDAAEAVADGGKRTVDDAGDVSAVHRPPFVFVLDSVAELVEHSLLRQDDRPDGVARFIMLETIREFASEQLAADREEAARAQMDHAAYFLALAERHERAAWVQYDASLPGRFEADLPNLRAALTWLEETGQAERVVQLAGALRWFWSAGGYVREGQEWLERGLASGETVGPAIRARAAIALSKSYYYQGDEPRARQRTTEALTLYRAVGDPLGQAYALASLGSLDLYREDFDAAIPCLEDALVLTNGTDDPEVAASIAAATLTNLGAVAHRRGDLALAAEYAEEALVRDRALGDIGGVIRNLYLSGNVAQDRGHPTMALERYQEGLRLATAHGDQRWTAALIENVAGIALISQLASRAARLFGAATTLRERTGFQARYPSERATFESGIAAARAALGEQEFTAAWNEGVAFAPDQAIAEALSTAMTDTREPFGDSVSAMDASDPFGLTTREREVLRLMAAGASNQVIADTLFISLRTAQTHVSHILAKLDLPSRTAAGAFARHHGLN